MNDVFSAVNWDNWEEKDAILNKKWCLCVGTFSLVEVKSGLDVVIKGFKISDLLPSFFGVFIFNSTARISAW